MNGFDLKVERLKARIPQWVLAQELHMSPTALCAVENGRSDLSPDLGARIRQTIADLRRRGSGRTALHAESRGG